MSTNADTIRHAIMCSLYNTGRTIEGKPYSHDDYDAAHSALNALVVELGQLQDIAIVAEELVAQPFGTLDSRVFYRLREAVRAVGE